jgi:hypothetical protein
MTLVEARQVFAHLMAAARRHKLTPYQRTRLIQARQILRRERRPAMNQSRRLARAILHRGKAHARKLTAKARRFFGARASGYPRRKAKKNPLTRMGKLVELRYHRDHGKHPGFYKHVFRSRPTVYYDASKRTIFIR